MSEHNPERPENDPKPNPHKKQGEKETTNCHVYIEPGAQIDFVKDLRNQYKTSQDQNTAHSEKILFWTKVSAWLLAIYIALTSGLVCLSYQSWKTTREFFQRDQRPYVFSNNVEPAQIVAPAGLATHIFYVNYGKTPAMHVRRAGDILHGDNALTQADEWFKKPARWAEGEGLLMQGDKPVTTIVPSSIPNGDQNAQYAVVMHIEYADIFGNPYWSDVCWWKALPNAAITRCLKHNEIH
jgi:hypothetical protein